MKQAVAFYRDVMGLPLKFETPGWTEFATEGATLALHGGVRWWSKPARLERAESR
jgi:catechol 2,3-dioxygenase-like lactoylglutathione lyase family enzyme